MYHPAKQIPIGLLVGLGAAASAALAALYVLYKKDDEHFELDSRNDDNTVTTTSFQSVRATTLFKIIPKEAIGAVIGKGGENIRLIQRKTNTKITFATENTLNDDEDRTVAIKGTPGGTLAADGEIDTIIDKAMACIVHRIYIPSSEVGLVIGKCGSTIKTISEESGAKVNVPRHLRGTKHQNTAIEIRGEPASVEIAVKMISDKLKISKSISSRSSSDSPVGIHSNGINGHANSLIFTPIHLNISAMGSDKFERLETNLENGCQDVYVASAQSPSKFWVQPCGTISADLDRLMIDMTDYYEKSDNQMRARINQYNIGDIVAAPLKGDEHWFRAKIIAHDDSRSRPGEGEVTVYYLDFGDESIVLEDQICSLHEEFLNRLTFQAIECSLFGVEPISDGWSEQAIDYFKKATRTSLWEKVFVKTHKVINMEDEPREQYCIEILALQDSTDISIAECLIEKGLAVSTIIN